LVISSQFAQFLINEREQLSGGFGITLLDVVQNLCEVAHLGDTNDAKRGGRGKECARKGIPGGQSKLKSIPTNPN